MTAQLAIAEPGAVLADLERIVSRADLIAYAAASGDQNPIHQDEVFARSVGLPGVIAHGMLTMALVGVVVEDIAGGADRVREFGARFAAPVVVPADRAVAVRIVVTLGSRDAAAGVATLDAAVSVAGTKVLSRSRAVIALD